MVVDSSKPCANAEMFDKPVLKIHMFSDVPLQKCATHFVRQYPLKKERRAMNPSLLG